MSASMPDSGQLVLLEHLFDGSVSPLPETKVRVAGRVVGRDIERSFLLLEHDGYAAVVDVALCLADVTQPSGASTKVTLPPLKSKVVVIAYVEANDENILLPTARGIYKIPTIERSVILRAILMQEKDRLDLGLWRDAVVGE